MERIFIHPEVGNFLSGLGSDRNEIESDWLTMSVRGPAWYDRWSGRCREIDTNFWEYRFPLGGSRYALFLFDYWPAANLYLVLHGLRGGIHGVDKQDIRIAMARRKAS